MEEMNSIQGKRISLDTNYSARAEKLYCGEPHPEHDKAQGNKACGNEQDVGNHPRNTTLTAWVDKPVGPPTIG
jgi:hypothetical protein